MVLNLGEIFTFGNKNDFYSKTKAFLASLQPKTLFKGYKRAFWDHLVVKGLNKLESWYNVSLVAQFFRYVWSV